MRLKKLYESGFKNCFMLVLLMCLTVLGMSAAKAQDSVCAEVRIVIEQEVSFERQGFDARMILRNGLTESDLSSVDVELLFMDKNGRPVAATQDPNAMDNLFFYRVDSLSGIESVDDGCVGSNTVAEMHWLIIPTAGAGGDDGELYFVGARVSYTLNGIDNVVEVTPDSIVVRPQPMLTLDYFLPLEVYADDAFTPEVEVPVPFTLGVRISNTGAGSANKMKIDSAQPRIIENEQGLIIDFEILGGYVSDEPVGKSLMLLFGDVAPKSAKIGRWVMQTTLSGRFTEFEANFSHADSLGGALTSLIEDVKTHMLIHDVKVNLVGRDGVRDFLAQDEGAIRVYESDGIDTDVTDLSKQAVLSVSGVQGKVTLPQQAGFIYAKINDPHKGTKPPVNVQRFDGKRLPVENAWLSKERNSDLSWSYYINIFDTSSAGGYNLSFADDVRSSISGSVFEDKNGDGLFNANEVGIPVVAVTLNGENEDGITVHVTGYTDIKGEFAFTELKPGRYELSVGDLDGMANNGATVGSAGGNAQLGKIADIVLGIGTQANQNLFAKRRGTSEVKDESTDLLIAGMSVSNATPAIGEAVRLLVVFGNAGNEVASDVVVELKLPEGVSLISSDATVGTYDSDLNQWVIGGAQLYETGLLQLMLQVNKAMPNQPVSALIGGGESDPNLANNQKSISLSVQ